jgi:hypothetical protein
MKIRMRHYQPDLDLMQPGAGCQAAGGWQAATLCPSSSFQLLTKMKKSPAGLVTLVDHVVAVAAALSRDLTKKAGSAPAWAQRVESMIWHALLLV